MLLLLIDFISKAYIYHIVPFYPSATGSPGFGLPIFYDFFGVDFFISLATNRGAAWGMFANFQILLVIIRILVIVGMFIYLFFLNRNGRIEIPLILVLAGAIGNIIDFFLYGFVIDFLHFNLWGYHFPIFNFADTCITIGVGWLFLAAYFRDKSSVLG